jgi:hypothetical protein
MTSKKLLRVRRKPYNMTPVFEDEAETMRTKKLTINPPARLMPTEIGTGVLGGNYTYGSGLEVSLPSVTVLEFRLLTSLSRTALNGVLL